MDLVEKIARIVYLGVWRAAYLHGAGVFCYWSLWKQAGPAGQAVRAAAHVCGRSEALRFTKRPTLFQNSSFFFAESSSVFFATDF